MSRIDKPTLKCDRCGFTTQDIKVMTSFQMLVHDHMSGRNEWDLCRECWLAFREFLGASQ